MKIDNIFILVWVFMLCWLCAVVIFGYIGRELNNLSNNMKEHLTEGEIELFIAIILVVIVMIVGVDGVSDWRLYSN